MKLKDTYENDGGWYMTIFNKDDGTAAFGIHIKEGPRRWRSESITLSQTDVVKLMRYLAAEKKVA